MNRIALVAFAVDLFAQVLFQVSFALQKSAHHDKESNQQKIPANDGGIFRTRKGFMGILLLVVASILRAWALSKADLTLLSVNASIAILANAFIAVKFLGERFDWVYDL